MLAPRSLCRRQVLPHIQARWSIETSSCTFTIDGNKVDLSKTLEDNGISADTVVDVVQTQEGGGRSL